MPPKPSGGAGGDGEGKGKKKKGPKPSKGKEGGALILPGAEKGQVVTRFPPEASGFLHIGHAKAAILNHYFARQYDGKLIVRFDDTNPAKEKTEFESVILEDLETLGVTTDVPLSYSSNWFPQMLEYAAALIEVGKAYVDDTVKEQMQDERRNGIDSRNRSLPPEESLKIWKQMQEGDESARRYCLRAKIDMQNVNMALRDPVIYRCSEIPHPRTGTQYKVYPTYDFCCPIVDSLEGVTHALRTTEYNDRDAQYKWVCKALGIRVPRIWAFSRLNMVQTIMSKRGLRWFVEQGLVDGWADPRFPTLRGMSTGMIRRGLTMEALRDFMIAQGPSKNIVLQEWDKIWTMNKKMIDPVVPRYAAVARSNRAFMRLSGVDATTALDQPLHARNQAVGSRDFFVGPAIYIEDDDAAMIEEGEEVTLMHWGNAIVKTVKKNEESGLYELDAELHLEGSVKSTKKKLNFVIATDEKKDELVDLCLVDFDFLITKKKLMEGEQMQDFLTKETRFETRALGEPAIAVRRAGDMLQIERRGFFRVDSVAEKSAVLFSIPSGKTTAMSTLTTRPT